jgi:membrane protein implicated in regulation of membrane protease activity
LGEASGIEGEARDQALALAARTELPLVARSLTAAVARIDGRATTVMLGIFGVFALPVLAIAALSGLTAGQLAITAVAAALLAALLWLLGRRRARARRAYLDPQIELEIGPDAMTLRRRGRVETLTYADARVAWKTATPRGVPYFLGLSLETPDGPLLLDDLWFRPGRTAAAAVVGRMEGVRAKVVL